VGDPADGLNTVTKQHFTPKINHTEECPYADGTLLLGWAGLGKAFRDLAGILEVYFYVHTVHID
jgi:hypothetical protein